MTAKLIAELASDDSKLFKENVIRREAAAGNTEFFAGLRLALDTMDTFGVKQVPEITDAARQCSGLNFSEFKMLADKLIKRELTGGAANDAICAAMEKATFEEWNGWYRLILIKDLKAGFSESTVNKSVKGSNPLYAIPVFEVQLAKDCVDDEGNIDDSLLCGKKQIDSKLDGMRVITIVYPDGRVDQYSRNGKELVNFSKIKDQLSACVKFNVPTVLDGEIMSASFQDLMKQARRKTNVQANDSILNLFDMLPLSEFVANKGTVTQLNRTIALNTWFDEVCEMIPNVTVVGSEIVDLDTDIGKVRLSEINKIALAGKYEGIMLKDVNAVYKCKRSVNWLKLKPFREDSLTVTGVEEGKPDSKFKGTMGALVCEEIIDGCPVKVHVGGGFSIQQRAEIWADYTGKPVDWQKKIKGKWVTLIEYPAGTGVIGMVAEVRSDALTKSDSKDTWSLRFPRFKTWRGLVSGEKM